MRSWAVACCLSFPPQVVWKFRILPDMLSSPLGRWRVTVVAFPCRLCCADTLERRLPSVEQNPCWRSAAVLDFEAEGVSMLDICLPLPIWMPHRAVSLMVILF